MTRASTRQAVLAGAAWNKGRAWPSSGKAMGPVGAAPTGEVLKGEEAAPGLGSVKRRHFYFMKILSPPPSALQSSRRIGGRRLACGQPRGLRGCSAPCWTAERPVPSAGEALGWAGPQGNLRMQGPSVIAQFPHVLGHHVEEESDKALGADTGHWGQKAMSAGLGRARAWLLWESLSLSVLSCKMGTLVPGPYPSLQRGQTDMANPPCHGNQAHPCLGDAPTAQVSARLAGPGAHLVPPRLQPACGMAGRVGESSFTFSAFTLSHHLGVCVLGPPSHEPAGKTGQERVSEVLA